MSDETELTNRQEELIVAIRELADEIGETPSLSDMMGRGEFSDSPYYHHFESWTTALEIAGFESKQTQKKITSEDLISEIQRVASEIGRTPRSRDMREYGKYSYGVYDSRFDSWGGALEKAGFNPEYDIRVSRPGTLIDEILRVAEIVDRPPYQRDMREHSSHNPDAFVRQFGSWGEALEFAGLPGRRRIARPAESEAINSGRYGSNWRSARLEALDRDRWRCQDCGVENGEYVAETGKSLDVHHIIPIREFDNAEEANFLLNLVTLCESCHKKWEPVTQAEWNSGGANA